MLVQRAWFLLPILNYVRFFDSFVATCECTIIERSASGSNACGVSEELDDQSVLVQTVTRSGIALEKSWRDNHLLGSNETQGKTRRRVGRTSDGNEQDKQHALNGQGTSRHEVEEMVYTSGSNMSSQAPAPTPAPTPAPVADWPDFREACRSALLGLQDTWQSFGPQTWLITIAGSVAEIGGGKSRHVSEIEEPALVMAGVIFLVILAGVGGFFLVRKGLWALSEQDGDGWQSTTQGMMLHHETLGILAVTTGAQLGAIGNATCKLMGSLPLLQLMQARFLLQCVCSLLACVVCRYYGHHIHILGQPGKRLLLVARACTFSGALGCLWAALAYMPMGEATAIVYFSPVLLAILAYLFLGEQLTCAFTLQALVSVVGVFLIIFCPVSSSDVNSRAAKIAGHSHETLGSRYRVGVFFAITSCICFALGNLVVRLLKDVHSLEVQVWQDWLTALVFMPIALLVSGENFLSHTSLLVDWSAWSSHDGFLLLAFTASGLAGSFLLILGFSLAPVGKAAPFVYTELCTSFALQVCFFGEVPGHCKILGASCVIVAALGRMFYEMQAAEPKEESPDAEPLFFSEHEPNAWERLVTPLPSPLQTEIYSH